METAQLAEKRVFAGDKKHLVHFLVPYERKLIKTLIPWVPPQIGTAHLTLMTVAWSVGVIFAGYAAATMDLRWLWLFSFCIFAQYVTDMLDGEVGRQRNTGLIKWGFYMDHFLDYIFLSSIVAGYSFLLPPTYSLWVMVTLIATAGFMVHSFLDFAITNNFKISVNEFGVSEARMTLIMFNTAMLIFGSQLLVSIYPFFAMAAFVGLVLLVYNSQKTYRRLDTTLQSVKEETPAPAFVSK
jgi:phosphatidylglycerophosphate synthase